MWFSLLLIFSSFVSKKAASARQRATPRVCPVREQEGKDHGGKTPRWAPTTPAMFLVPPLSSWLHLHRVFWRIIPELSGGGGLLLALLISLPTGDHSSLPVQTPGLELRTLPEAKANHFQCKQLEAIIRRPRDSKRQKLCKKPPRQATDCSLGDGSRQAWEILWRLAGGQFVPMPAWRTVWKSSLPGERKELLKDAGP